MMHGPKTGFNPIQANIGLAQSQVTGPNPHRQCVILGPSLQAGGQLYYCFGKNASTQGGILVLTNTAPVVLTRQQIGEAIQLDIWARSSNAADMATVAEFFTLPG